MRCIWLLPLLPVASEAAVASTIGTGLSQAPLTGSESLLFAHEVSAEGQWAYLNHFWAAGSNQVSNTVFRYYIDGETSASVAFTPEHACGVGFGDATAPWGNKWLGKGAKSTGWFHNIPIPFYKSVRVTFQMGNGTTGADGQGTIWAIVRGAEGLPMRLGNLELPLSGGTVRLDLQVRQATLKPLEFYDLVEVPRGLAGSIFLTALMVKGAKDDHYMEGCFHFYSPPEQAWPGLLLATGMEDYFDSAYYFNGGGFHLPVSGLTHKGTDGSFSGYRLHEMDPLVFKDGVRMQWRNGDVTDGKTGLKCTVHQGQVPMKVTESEALSYAWVYTWKPQQAATLQV